MLKSVCGGKNGSLHNAEEEMIKENIEWKDDLPIRALVADIKEWPLHFHNDIELIYVLDGDFTVRSGGYTHKLTGGDIFIINSNEIHSIIGSRENNMIMSMHLSKEYFMRYYPELANRFFFISAKAQRSSEADMLKDNMSCIMLEIMEKGRHYKEKVVENTHNTVAHLLANFSHSYDNDENEERGGSKILTRRLARIMNYICGNYNRKLTLREIAEHEDLSIYYLSHIIKEYTQMSFQDFLNYLRAYESVGLLKETNKKISVISEEMGFSAVRYYIKHFEISYGITPQEYRSKYKDGTLASYDTGYGCTYSRSRADDIRKALKANSEEVYREILFGNAEEPVIVEINLCRNDIENGSESVFPCRLFATETMKLLARPYNIIQSLHERVVASGINYLATVAETEKGEVIGGSLLMYNLDEEICGELRASSFDKAAILKCIENMETRTDFLVKLTGLQGEYIMNRYRMSSENAVTAYEDAINKQNFIGRRQMILNNWRTFPSIETRRISVTATLNVISRLSGFSAELILLDKVRDDG